MATTVQYVETKEYSLKGILEGEIDVVEEMLDKSGYLCDAISETADSNIPIYNAEIWEGASSISEYIEEAIAEGLAPTEGRDIDLIRIFQSGYYVFYQSLLYDNLDAIAFNYIAEKVNEFLENFPKAKDVDIAEVEGAIEEEADSTDNNDTFSDLEDKAQSIIERIQEGDFSPMED
jgi:hypothetical protein